MSAQQRIAAGLARLTSAVVALSARAPTSGGTAGQVWTKNSATNNDASWQTPAAGGASTKRPYLWG